MKPEMAAILALGAVSDVKVRSDDDPLAGAREAARARSKAFKEAMVYDVVGPAFDRMIAEAEAKRQHRRDPNSPALAAAEAKRQRRMARNLRNLK